MNYDICVFGGCAMDVFYYADSNGNYPKSPSLYAPGGKGSNQAVAASRAGAKTTIITRLGNDEIGKQIVDNLDANGIDISNVDMVDGLDNDVAIINVNSSDKDNSIVRKTGAINSFDVDMIEKYKDVLLDSKIVVAQMKIPKEVSVKLIEFCHEHNIPIIITPCRPKKLRISDDNNSELIDKISFITCNKEECFEVFGTDDVEECVRRYPNKLIVTLGGDGLIYNNGSENIHLEPVQTDNIVDTTGCGDTFAGVFATALASGASIDEAIRRGNYAAGMKVSVESAQAGMPTKPELDQFIEQFEANDSKGQK